MAKALLFTVVAAWLVDPGAAQAYLDPATGSVVLQVLVGGVMGGLFVLKRYWGHLKAWFTRKGGADSEATMQQTRPDRDRE